MCTEPQVRDALLSMARGDGGHTEHQRLYRVTFEVVAQRKSHQTRILWPNLRGGGIRGLCGSGLARGQKATTPQHGAAFRSRWPRVCVAQVHETDIDSLFRQSTYGRWNGNRHTTKFVQNVRHLKPTLGRSVIIPICVHYAYNDVACSVCNYLLLDINNYAWLR